MDLSIIIVNWNSKHYLKCCIDSILNSTFGVKFEIIVIDSASFDGCDEMLKQYYPQVTFIQNDRNLGFAGANNKAFRVANGKNLLFLNPDTEIISDAIPILFHHLESLPNAGAVGAKLLNTDKSLQISCIRAYPSIMSEFLDSEFLIRKFPYFKLWGIAPLFNRSIEPIEVDAVSGACIMINKERFESIGMFSTDYFMYSEDIDLCFKINKTGWKTYYIPGARVIHHGGGSSSQSKMSAFSTTMMLESRWKFFRKNRSKSYAQLYRIIMFSASVIRVGLIVSVLQFAGPIRKSESYKCVLDKWKFCLRWSLGREVEIGKYASTS